MMQRLSFAGGRCRAKQARVSARVARAATQVTPTAATARGFTSEPNLNLAPTVKLAKQSPTLAIQELMGDMCRRGQEVIRFGLGESPFPVMPGLVPALAASASHKSYLPTAGAADLREAIARYANGRASDGGVANRYSADNVVVSPGTKELLFDVQLALNAELVIPDFSWVTYHPQANLLGRPTNWIPVYQQDDWKVVPGALDEALSRGGSDDRSQLFILNSPNNPSGGVYTDGELAELAQVLRKHGAIAISDEIYCGVAYGRDMADATARGRRSGGVGVHRSHSLAHHYPEGTIVLDGLSKWAGAGGWRLGWMTFPPQLQALRQAVVAIASETYSAVSAPMQAAALAVLAGDLTAEQQTYLRAQQAILGGVADLVVGELASAGVDVAVPAGGFYCAPAFGSAPAIDDFRAKWAAEAGADDPSQMPDTWLVQQLLTTTGVALLPGSAFGLSPTCPDIPCRLAFVDFDGEAALAAHAAQEERTGEPVQRVTAAFVEKQCPRVAEGVRRLAAFLRDGPARDS